MPLLDLTVSNGSVVEQINAIMPIAGAIGGTLIALRLGWRMYKLFVCGELEQRDIDDYADHCYEKLENGEELTDEEAEFLWGGSDEPDEEGFESVDGDVNCPYCGAWFSSDDEEQYQYHIEEKCNLFDYK